MMQCNKRRVNIPRRTIADWPSRGRVDLRRLLPQALRCDRIRRGGGAEGERMTEVPASLPSVREAVASFPDRRHFHMAVANLLAAGFAPSDLSVLATHDSLATAGEPEA